MPGTEWVFAILAITIGAHLMILSYVYLHRRNPTADGEDDGSIHGGGTCRCADCGAENEAGYRFCKRCIAELPTQAPFGDRGGHHSNPS